MDRGSSSRVRLRVSSKWSDNTSNYPDTQRQRHTLAISEQRDETKTHARRTSMARYSGKPDAG